MESLAALPAIIYLAVAGLVFLILSGQMATAEDLTLVKFRRMVESELERTKVENDSIGATVQVKAFGEKARDFMLAPVVHGGKVVVVYKDDPSETR